MSHAIVFDTLAFAKELEAAGVPSIQAEAHAKVMAATLQQVEESRIEELATKRDISDLRHDMKGLEVKIAESKAETIKWIVTLSLAQLGVLTGILFAIFRMAPH